MQNMSPKELLSAIQSDAQTIAARLPSSLLWEGEGDVRRTPIATLLSNISEAADRLEACHQDLEERAGSLSATIKRLKRERFV